MNPADEFKAAVQLALETRVAPLCEAALSGEFPAGVVWQSVVNEALETLGAEPGEAGLRNWLSLPPVPEYALPSEPVREWAERIETDMFTEFIETGESPAPVWIPQTYGADGLGHRPELTGSEAPVVWRCSVRGKGWCEVGRFPETVNGCAEAEKRARDLWGESAGIVEPA